MSKHFKKILYFLLLCINIIFPNTPDNIFYKEDNKNFNKNRHSTNYGSNIAGQFINTMKLFDIYTKKCLENLSLLDNKIIFYSNKGERFSLEIIEYKIDDNYTYNMSRLNSNNDYTYNITQVNPDNVSETDEENFDKRFKAQAGIYKHEIEITKVIYRNTVTMKVDLSQEYFLLFDLTEIKYSSILNVINIMHYITNLMKYTFFSDDSITYQANVRKNNADKEKIIEILKSYKNDVQAEDRKEFDEYLKDIIRLDFPSSIKNKLKTSYSRDEEERFTNSLEDLHKSLLEDLEKFIIYYKFNKIGVYSNIETEPIRPILGFNELINDSNNEIINNKYNQLLSTTNKSPDNDNEILKRLFGLNNDDSFEKNIEKATGKCKDKEIYFHTNTHRLSTIIALINDLKNTEDNNIKKLSLLYLMIFKSSPQVYIKKNKDEIRNKLSYIKDIEEEGNINIEEEENIKNKCNELLGYLEDESLEDKLLNSILSETYKVYYKITKYFYKDLSENDLKNIVKLNDELNDIDYEKSEEFKELFNTIRNKLKYLIYYHQKFLNTMNDDEISQISNTIDIPGFKPKVVTRRANYETKFNHLLKKRVYTKEINMTNAAKAVNAASQQASKFQSLLDKHDQSDIETALDEFHRNNTESQNTIDSDSYYSNDNIDRAIVEISQDDKNIQLFTILLNFLDYIIKYVIVLIFAGSMIMSFVKFIMTYNDDDWRKVSFVVGELFFKLLISIIILNNIKVIYLLSAWITDSALYLFSYINTGIIQLLKYPNLLINILFSTSMMERYKIILMIDAFDLLATIIKLFLTMLCISILIGYYWKLLMLMTNFFLHYITAVFFTPIFLSIYFIYSGSQGILLQVIKKLFTSIVFISFTIVIYNLTEQIIIDIILSILGDSLTYGEYTQTENNNFLKPIWRAITNIFFMVINMIDFLISWPNMMPISLVIIVIICYSLYSSILLILQIIFIVLFSFTQQMSTMYREPYLLNINNEPSLVNIIISSYSLDLIAILTMYFLLSEITTSLNFIISYYFDENENIMPIDSLTHLINSGGHVINGTNQAIKIMKAGVGHVKNSMKDFNVINSINQAIKTMEATDDNIRNVINKVIYLINYPNEININIMETHRDNVRNGMNTVINIMEAMKAIGINNDDNINSISTSRDNMINDINDAINNTNTRIKYNTATMETYRNNISNVIKQTINSMKTVNKNIKKSYDEINRDDESTQTEDNNDSKSLYNKDDQNTNNDIKR